MKNVVVFFDQPGKEGYPFDDVDYVDSYRELAEKIEQGGGTLFVARTQDSYRGGNTFSSGWKYVNGELRDVADSIESDVIFNKGNLVSDATATVIDVPDIETLCTDKSKTYAQFPTLCPLSFVVHHQNELENACAQIPSAIIVAKPLDKEGGAGVIIAPKDEVLRSITTFPYMIQEFIDTSAGIEGIVDGHHDFRIVCVNGEITHCEYRTPPEGMLTANVSRGGKFAMVEKKNIPAGAMKVFESVESYMKRFPKRIYSVDMGRNIDGRWLIIEMNSKPGLLPARYGKDFITTMNAIATLLVDVAENGI